MGIKRAVSVIVTVASIAACSGGDGYLTGAGNGNGNGGGGGAAGAVTVGSGIQFVSGHNATMNPAVDTIVAGSAITWTWTGTLPHSVRSLGTPSFTSSGTQTSGTYVVTFTTPGTYRYQCDVHGQAMTGTIVVLPTTNSLGGGYEQTASVADGTSDTFGSAATRWDLTALTIARDPAGITAMLDFSRDVVAPAAGDPSAPIALIDLDLDQNASTGSAAMADLYRQDGRTTALGVDARVNLAAPDEEGAVAVSDDIGHETGRVTPSYAGHRITIRVPRAMLGNDDGFVNASAIVGVAGSVTDFVPNAGHLTLDRAVASASISPSHTLEHRS